MRGPSPKMTNDHNSTLQRGRLRVPVHGVSTPASTWQKCTVILVGGISVSLLTAVKLSCSCIVCI